MCLRGASHLAGTADAVGAGSLACGGSVDGDTTKGLQERGHEGKEVYYTLTTGSTDTRSAYRFSLTNVKTVTGGGGPDYVTVYDDAWKAVTGRGYKHTEATLKPSKKYYVLVEGSNAANAGTFTLKASCAAPGTSEQGTCGCGCRAATAVVGVPLSGSITHARCRAWTTRHLPPAW